MTNEEARQWFLKVYSEIKGKGYADENEEAYELAIKALEQESSRDIKEIAEIMKCDADAETKCKMISNILTAKPHYFEEQEPCDDVISREDAIKAQCEVCDICGNTQYTKCQYFMQGCNEVKCLRDLPSIRPQEQTGHWIKKDGYSDCSECGSHIVTEWDYCPKCGAKMVEPQESEDDKK